MRAAGFVFIFSMLISGCAGIMLERGRHLEKNSYHYYNEYEVEIVSDPPGAEIEWDGEYVGQTPVTYKLTGRKSFINKAVVKAYPIESGQYMQTKVLRHPVPKKIYFDLNLAPAKWGHAVKQ